MDVSDVSSALKSAQAVPPQAQSVTPSAQNAHPTAQATALSSLPKDDEKSESTPLQVKAVVITESIPKQIKSAAEPHAPRFCRNCGTKLSVGAAFCVNIAENPILHIRTAVISDLSDKAAKQSEPENTEVIVSYFGVLLDEKVIKFNQDGIRIRAVEIGGDFISFTYGTEKRTKNIRLLRQTIESEELDKIVEKFRYETGITPILLS